MCSKVRKSRKQHNSISQGTRKWDGAVIRTNGATKRNRTRYFIPLNARACECAIELVSL